MAGQIERRVASDPPASGSRSGAGVASGSTIDSTGTWMRRSSSLRIPVSTILHVRVGPTRNRPISSSGFCVADRPIRWTSLPAAFDSRSSVSARCAPRLVAATAWISSTMHHCAPSNSSFAREVSIRYSDSGVVIRMSGGSRNIACRSRCGVSPVRTATFSPASIPLSGARRLRSMSYESALSGETYTRPICRSSSFRSSLASRSIAQRNAARVFPDPVGAEISTCSPDAIAGHACSCAGVGASKAASNQVRVAGLNCSSGTLA